MHASTSTHARTKAAWHAPTSWAVIDGLPIPVNMHVFKVKFLFLLSASLLSLLLLLFQEKNLLGLKLDFFFLIYYPRVFWLFVCVFVGFCPPPNCSVLQPTGVISIFHFFVLTAGSRQCVSGNVNLSKKCPHSNVPAQQQM